MWRQRAFGVNVSGVFSAHCIAIVNADRLVGATRRNAPALEPPHRYLLTAHAPASQTAHQKLLAFEFNGQHSTANQITNCYNSAWGPALSRRSYEWTSFKRNRVHCRLIHMLIARWTRGRVRSAAAKCYELTQLAPDKVPATQLRQRLGYQKLQKTLARIIKQCRKTADRAIRIAVGLCMTKRVDV